MPRFGVARPAWSAPSRAGSALLARRGGGHLTCVCEEEGLGPGRAGLGSVHLSPFEELHQVLEVRVNEVRGQVTIIVGSFSVCPQGNEVPGVQRVALVAEWVTWRMFTPTPG